MSPRDELVIRTCTNRMPLCGCGSSETMWKIVAAILERSAAKGEGRPSFYDPMPELDLSATAVEFIAHVIERSGFMEHGTSIGYAWLSTAGVALLRFLREHPDYEKWPEYAHGCGGDEPFTLSEKEWHELTFHGGDV